MALKCGGGDDGGEDTPEKLGTERSQDHNRESSQLSTTDDQLTVQGTHTHTQRKW